jgi:hypothetical protein
MAPGSRLNTSRQTAPLRLAYSAPEPDSATIEELRRLTLPATKALPFVKLRINDQPLWRPECYWSVQSTGKRGLDVALGRAYARRAITAMKADHNPTLIGLIIQDIISDSVKRGGKNGRGRLSHLALGFLNEISRTVAADAGAE